MITLTCLFWLYKYFFKTECIDLPPRLDIGGMLCLTLIIHVVRHQCPCPKIIEKETRAFSPQITPIYRNIIDTTDIKYIGLITILTVTIIITHSIHANEAIHTHVYICVCIHITCPIGTNKIKMTFLEH